MSTALHVPIFSFLSFHGCESRVRGFCWADASRMSGVSVWREEFGGLGSSHTTPCGAVVPARPPTRSSDITGRVCAAQWAGGATQRGTRVVVLGLYSFFRTGVRMYMIM